MSESNAEEDVMSACEADTHMAAAQATNAAPSVKPPSRDDDAATLNNMVEDLEGIIKRARRRREGRIHLGELETAQTALSVALTWRKV